MNTSDILLLPELWTDETIYSLVARIARLNGMNHLTVVGQLLGEKYPTSTIGCPINIRHFCEVTKYVYGFPKDILHLTIMPLMAHLGDVSSSDITDIENGNRRPEFGAMVFGINKGCHWRICRKCVERDVNVYGTSYWHRSHQLPTCLYCPEHGVMLDSIDIQRVRLNDHLCLPNEFTNLFEHKNQYDTQERSKICWDMSILGRDALADYSFPFSKRVIQATFLAALKRMLLVTSNGEVNLNDFLEEFERKSWPEISINSMLSLSKLSSPRQLLNGLTNEFESKPIARLMLVHLLFDTWGAFKEPCRWQEAFDDAENNSAISQSMLDIAAHPDEDTALIWRLLSDVQCLINTIS